MPRRSGSQRGKAGHPPTADRDQVDREADLRQSNPRGEIAVGSAPSQASSDATRRAPGSEPRQAGIAFPPWLRLPAADAATVVLLLIATTLAWCSANAKWTPRAWSRPTAYMEPANTDMFFTLAYMKAAAEGQLLPFAWKSVSELGAPYDANWSDWPLIEELQHTFLGLLARVFGLFAGLNIGLLIGNLLATAVSYAVCRASGCNRTWSAVAAFAFGLAPYAFAQSPHHITCEYVWHIPLFLLVWKWAATEGGLEPWTPRFWGRSASGSWRASRMSIIRTSSASSRCSAPRSSTAGTVRSPRCSRPARSWRRRRALRPDERGHMVLSIRLRGESRCA